MKNLFKLFPLLGISLIAVLFIGCSDDDDPKSNEALITKMSFESTKVTKQPIIDATNIKFYVAYDITDDELKKLVPTITISEKATVNPESGKAVDFSSDPVKFIVTAEDEITKTTYTVTCVKEANAEASILEMTFEDEIVTDQPVIDETNIKFFVAYNATPEDLKELVPTIKVSDKATVDPASGSKVDFSGDPVNFTVTAEDGKSKTVYTVTCEKGASTEASILEMTFEDEIVTVQPVIEETDIKFFVVYGATDEQLKELVPTIKVSDKATVDPESGSKVDFSGDDPVEFTVTAEDGVTKTVYTVSFERSANTESSMLSISFDSPIVTTQPVINGTNIIFNVSENATLADLKEIIPTMEISDNATVKPALGSKVDFTRGTVDFTVTAENKKLKTVYKVTLWQNKFNMENWVVENPTAGDESSYIYAPLGAWSSSNTGALFLKAMKDPAGNPYADKFVVTQSNDSYSGSKAARIETIDTKGGDLGFTAIPKVTTGSLFIGKFSTSLSNTLESTKFGIPYNKKPLTLKGYYKYKPGDVFYQSTYPGDPKKAHIVEIDPNKTDECAINAILYEIEKDNDPYLTGVDAYTSSKLVAVAKLADGTARANYTPFSINFEPVNNKVYDPNKKYRLSIICSSSKWGDTFSGAPGSVLYVDDIELISE